MRAIAFASVVFLGLAACDAPTQGGAANTVDPSGVPTAAQAVRLFDAICAATLPNFKAAPAAMKANGINIPSPISNTTKFHANGKLSFKVLDGPGVGKTCSLVFETTESEATVNAAFAALGKFVDGPTGLGTIYKGALVLRKDPKTFEGRSVYNLRMLSKR